MLLVSDFNEMAEVILTTKTELTEKVRITFWHTSVKSSLLATVLLPYESYTSTR